MHIAIKESVMNNNYYDSKMITNVFWRLLPVQILIATISSINGIIDATVASNIIGPDAIAATGLFFPLTKILDTVNIVLLGGAQIMCGKMLGKNQVERTKGVFTLDMVVIAIVSIALTLAGLFFSYPLAKLLGASSVLIDKLSMYIVGMAPGFLAYMVVAQLSSFLQLERQENRTYVGVAVMAVTNLALDILFVAKLKMGMFGLGLATSLGNWLYLIFLGSYYFTKKAIIRFDIKTIDISELKEIVSIGIPGAVTQLGQVVRGFVLNYIFLVFVGDNGVSAYAAVISFGGIFFATNAAVSAASRLLISVYVGEKDVTGIKIVLKTALTKGMLLAAGMSILTAVFSKPLTMIFYDPEAGEIFNMTRLGFVLFPVSMILSCIFIVFSNYYQSLSRIKIVNILSILDGGVGMVAFSLLLAPVFKMTGIWTAQILNGVVTLFGIIIYTLLFNKSIPKKFDDYMVLDDDFAVSADNRMDISIHTMDKVIEASKNVHDFCIERLIDEKHAMYAALSIEEMAGNIVEHGFIDNKKHSIDVRIVYTGAELILRIKDDCKGFNPKERVDMLNPEDPAHNIGLRLISRLANEMMYQNTFGLNVLTIRVTTLKLCDFTTPSNQS